MSANREQNQQLEKMEQQIEMLRRAILRMDSTTTERLRSIEGIVDRIYALSAWFPVAHPYLFAREVYRALGRGWRRIRGQKTAMQKHEEKERKAQ